MNGGTCLHRSMTKSTLAQTVLNYIKKNPLNLNRRWERYIRSKRGILLESNEIKENCFCDTVLFHDGSHIIIGSCMWMNDDDRTVIVFKFVKTENEDWNNEVKYTEKDLDEVN
jgi:hypothetical protein